MGPQRRPIASTSAYLAAVTSAIGAHDNWHMPMSLAAAKAGKDICCQKPLGLDFGLTKLLRTVVRDQQRIFQFGTQYRSVPRYRQMIQLEGFCASNESMWQVNFKPSDEQLMISAEHNRNFIDCVKSRQETICPVEMAIRCDAICQIANIAARTGRAIQWDAESETIIGDADASQMLTLPYRDQWKVW